MTEVDAALKIDPAKAGVSRELKPGVPPHEGVNTTHYSIVDNQGNAVSVTYTLNDRFGAKVTAANTGILLNDEMDDFASKPGEENMFHLVQGEANAIQPGKRMLSAMSPTIVLDPRGNLLLVTGARGGPRIISATSQIILNVIDHRMSLADAMSAPRIHHQSLPDSIRVEAGRRVNGQHRACRRLDGDGGPARAVERNENLREVHRHLLVK